MRNKSPETLRYFVFFYRGAQAGKIAQGMFFLSDQKRMPRISSVIKDISEKTYLGIDEIVITGWKEMSKKDFNDFSKEDLAD